MLSGWMMTSHGQILQQQCLQIAFCISDYLKEFHAYEEGNLSWKVRSRCFPVTASYLSVVQCFLKLFLVVYSILRNRRHLQLTVIVSSLTITVINITYCPQAASEVAPATLSMMLRAIPTAQSATEASQILRGAWLQVQY